MSIVRMSRFGQMGRFGNQIFQAMFINTYAARYGAKAELMPWIGDDLFAADTPRSSGAKLPTYTEIGGVSDYPLPPPGAEVVGHDFAGYAQYHTGYYSKEEQDAIRLMFIPAPNVAERLSCATWQLAERAVIGMHFRRGDYGQLMYYITPIEWYKKKLAELWCKVKNPLLFIASEDPKIVAEFSEYNPVTSESLGVKLSDIKHKNYNYLDHDIATREPLQMDFFPDYYLLTRCDYLLIPNSTFSFSAAMLAPSLRGCFRSSLHTEGFVEIDPWNAVPLQFDYVDDFPNVSGISLETSPYWSRQPGNRRILKPLAARERRPEAWS